ARDPTLFPYTTLFRSANFNFGFQPTKLRLRNTRQNGRGTRTWRFTALPINGIMNFTYIDPATGRNLSCTSECPLSDNRTVAFQRSEEHTSELQSQSNL